jgi:hypothetical protein
MRKLSLLLMLYFSGNLVYFAQVRDDFKDLNQWEGQTTKFSINQEQLQLKDVNNTSSAYLVTPSTISIEANWQFWVKMDFAPSSANRLEVALLSNQSKIDSSYQGYYLSIGENGNLDAIELWRKNGITKQLLARGVNGRFANRLDSIVIKVERTLDYTWTVSTKTNDSWITEFSHIDSTYLQSRFFGFRPIYTSTRNNLFYFDDLHITGKAYVDTIAPLLDSIAVNPANTITLWFSETIDTNALMLSSFLLDQVNCSGFTAMGNTITLSFKNIVPNKNQILSLTGIKDVFGNTINKKEVAVFYLETEVSNILITELMVDPSDSPSLPNSEYIELFNTTNFPINLLGWTVKDIATTSPLPAFVLSPQEYVLLCPLENKNLFLNQTNIIGLASWPTLNNTGDSISLIDKDGNVIAEFNYSLASYQSDDKKNGGYSLELQDYTSPCLADLVISASKDPRGGTPNQKNAGIDLFVAQGFSIDDFTIANNSIELTFNAKPNILSVNQLEMSPSQAFTTTQQNNKVTLALNQSLDPSINYKLSLRNSTNCVGELLDTTITFLIGQAPSTGDLFISELLFNPIAGQQDFVEIFVNSDKPINTDGLTWLRFDPISEEILHTLDFPKTVLLPKCYYVFSTSTVLSNNYVNVVSTQLVNAKLPSLNDDEGLFGIQNKQGEVIEKVAYQEDWHAPYLVNKEGVSLERISLTKSALDKSNWFSGSRNQNFGSPTQANSASNKVTPQKFGLSQDHISPDSDGFEDFCFLNFNNLGLGTLINVSWYSTHGQYLFHEYQNYSLSLMGELRIDGLSADTKTLNPGIYVLFVEWFSVDGETGNEKFVFTINGKF